MKTFKYRLRPSKSQRTNLMRTLELCRWLYNETLAVRKKAWEQASKSLSLYDTNKMLTLWKQEHPELKDVFSQVLQNVQERVDLAFKAFFRRDEQELAKSQRKFSKAEKGTPERAKHRKAIQHIHQRIAHRRKDFAHKLSRQLVNNFGLMVFEKLNTKNMLQNHCLAKSIQDAAWSQLMQYTTYKAENAGREVVLVEPRNTSKICSRCGTMVEKSLSVRVHACPVCGLVIDRDQNASCHYGSETEFFHRFHG